MSLSRRIGTLVMLVVIFFGTFCMFDLYRTLNIKNIVIGYFQHSDDVVQISDFEYDIQALLFTNSGDNENTYFATANGKPVSNFDNTKHYTVAINGIRANRVYDTTNYVNANFTNTFYSTQDTILLTDTINIKVNFYTEGTKIIFLTQNGETAVSLWNSYIQKNGFKLTIIEDNFTPTIQADNLPEYTVNLYVEDELYQSKTLTVLSDRTMPTIYLDNKRITGWQDINENTYTELPLQNINLYAVVETGEDFSLLNFTVQNALCSYTQYTNNANYSGVCHFPGVYKLLNEDEKNFILKVADTSISKSILINYSFYGRSFSGTFTSFTVNDSGTQKDITFVATHNTLNIQFAITCTLLNGDNNMFWVSLDAYFKNECDESLKNEILTQFNNGIYNVGLSGIVTYQ